jgi:acylphosphatase
MKLKITIIGPRVHDVGYRYFLMSYAMANRIRMFEAQNVDSDGVDAVLVLVDGGEREIDAFRKQAETKRPERAEVSRVVVEDYDGDVMRIAEYAQFCAAVQMNKAIPLLLNIADRQEETVSEIRGLRGDLVMVRNNTEWQARMEKDVLLIKSKLGI